MAAQWHQRSYLTRNSPAFSNAQSLAGETCSFQCHNAVLEAEYKGIGGRRVLDFLALQTAVSPPPEEGQVFGHVVLHERTRIEPIYGL